MDEIYLDYEPRNAVVRSQHQTHGRPNTFYSGAAAVTNRPVLRPQAAPTQQVLPPAVYAAPIPSPYYNAPTPFYPPGYVPPGYIPPGYAPASKLGSKLSDLTVGDVVPLLAQLVIAFRPMPVAPADGGDVGTNLVNVTKFVDAIARHFHADQQLNAAGQAAGTLLR